MIQPTKSAATSLEMAQPTTVRSCVLVCLHTASIREPDSQVEPCQIRHPASSFPLPAGQFYECLNMAALYKLPCIFVVENNKWAIGMNHPRATGPTLGDNEPFIYKKGPAFGMPGVHVDGMDVLKVSSSRANRALC